MALALLAPILGTLGADVAVVAGLVLVARVAIFVHRFIRRGL